MLTIVLSRCHRCYNAANDALLVVILIRRLIWRWRYCALHAIITIRRAGHDELHCYDGNGSALPISWGTCVDIDTSGPHDAAAESQPPVQIAGVVRHRRQSGRQDAHRRCRWVDRMFSSVCCCHCRLPQQFICFFLFNFAGDFSTQMRHSRKLVPRSLSFGEASIDASRSSLHDDSFNSKLSIFHLFFSRHSRFSPSITRFSPSITRFSPSIPRFSPSIAHFSPSIPHFSPSIARFF